VPTRALRSGAVLSCAHGALQPDLPDLIVLEYPLIAHKRTHLRRRGTGKKLFK